MKVEAYLNHGRWIVDCPKCGKLGATLAEPNPSVSPYSAENGYICPNCYPGIIAFIDGRIPDEKMRQKTRERAASNGEIYEVAFPKERKDIEKIVSHRRLDHKNWQPGETLTFLKNENKILGVK